MKKEDFEKRLRIYVPVFRGLFKSGKTKRKLKETIYNSDKFTEKQKDIFWKEVVREWK